MAGVLANSLPDLPFVHSLDLTDNNLSGTGLQPIILALAQLPSLTKLTLSQNVINRDSATALASYVSQVSAGGTLPTTYINHKQISDASFSHCKL